MRNGWHNISSSHVLPERGEPQIHTSLDSSSSSSNGRPAVDDRARGATRGRRRARPSISITNSTAMASGVPPFGAGWERSERRRAGRGTYDRAVHYSRAVARPNAGGGRDVDPSVTDSLPRPGRAPRGCSNLTCLDYPRARRRRLVEGRGPPRRCLPTLTRRSARAGMNIDLVYIAAPPNRVVSDLRGRGPEGPCSRATSGPAALLRVRLRLRRTLLTACSGVSLSPLALSSTCVGGGRSTLARQCGGRASAVPWTGVHQYPGACRCAVVRAVCASVCAMAPMVPDGRVAM